MNSGTIAWEAESVPREGRFRDPGDLQEIAGSGKVMRQRTKVERRATAAARWAPSRPLGLVAALFTASGILLELAMPIVSIRITQLGSGMVAGLALMVIGLGLFKGRLWAWSLALAFTLFGAVGVGFRLAGDSSDGIVLIGVLLIDLLVAALLLRAWPKRVSPTVPAEDPLD